MLPIILMASGIALFAIGLYFLFNLLIDPIKTAFGVVLKRKDDYVFYESDKGKELLRRKKKSVLTASIFFLIVGAILFGIGYFMKFSPHGYEEAGDVAEVSINEVDDMHVQGLDKDGKYHDKDGKIYSSYIEVTGLEIRHNGQLIGDIDAFQNYVSENKISRTMEIYVIDNYAASSAYHKVIEILSERAIPFNKD